MQRRRAVIQHSSDDSIIDQSLAVLESDIDHTIDNEQLLEQDGPLLQQVLPNIISNDQHDYGENEAAENFFIMSCDEEANQSNNDMESIINEYERPRTIQNFEEESQDEYFKSISIDLEQKHVNIESISDIFSVNVRKLPKRIENQRLQESTELSIKDIALKGMGIENIKMRTFFAMTGYYNGEKYKCSLKSYPTASNKVRVLDLDSAMIIIKDFPSQLIDGPLQYFPVPNRQNTLKTSIHITVRIDNEQKGLSQIPNFELARFGYNSEISVLIFFPHLMRKKGNLNVNIVSRKQMMDFYDHIAMPALISAGKRVQNNLFLNNIPLSYALFESICNVNGSYKFAPVGIPCEIVPEFFKSLKLNLDRSILFADSFYVIFAKGMKQVFHNGQYCFTGIQRLRFWENCRRMYPQQTYFDLAVTYYSDKTDIPCVVLPKSEWVDKMLKSNIFKVPKFDKFCLLDDVKLFRAETKESILKNTGLVYFQIYSTEKYPIVRKYTNSLASMLTTSEVCGNTKKYKRAVETLKNIWPLMIQSNYGLRIELRMTAESFSFHQQNNLEIIQDMIQNDDLIEVPCHDLCLYKLFLASTYSYVINHVHKRNPICIDPKGNEFLTLATMSLLLNGLVSRLNDCSWNKEIQEILDISLCTQLNGRVTIPIDQWNLDRMQITEVPQRELKITKYFGNHEKIHQNSNSIEEIEYKTTEEAVKKLFLATNEEIWKHLSCWTTVHNSFFTSIPEGCELPLTLQNLERLNIRYVTIRSSQSWSKRLEEMYNMEGRILHGKHMQHWNNLKYIKLYFQLQRRLGKRNLEFLNNAISAFWTESDIVIPGFEPRGKYFRSKRTADGPAFVVYMRK